MKKSPQKSIGETGSKRKGRKKDYAMAMATATIRESRYKIVGIWVQTKMLSKKEKK